MARWRDRSKVLGPAAVVIAIAVGATLPVALSAAAGQASMLSSHAPLSACSPPVASGSAPPVAAFSPPCAPTLTADPSAELADGQTITVTGAGFTPNASIGMAECEASALDPSSCDLSNVVIVPSDSTGGFSADFTVSRVISVNNTTIDCALSPCILGAADISNYSVDAAAAISFNPKIPPALTGTVAPTDKVNTHTGVAYIAGTVTCKQPTTVQLFVTLQQTYHRRWNFTNSIFTSVTCKAGKRASKWRVAVPPGIGLFGVGKATVHVDFAAPVGNSYRTFSISSGVVLQGSTKK